MLPTSNRRRRGFSLVELLIVIAIILIILAIAVPKLSSARMQAQEMAAAAQIKTLNTAESMYLSQFGNFATTLAQLGPPTSGNPGPSAADLISGDLATGKKGGYTYTLTQTPQGYSITAVPDVYNTTGRRTFFTDQTMVIRQNWTQEPATAASPELK